MSTPAVNPYEMSMEELAQLSAGVALPPPEQPRDEKGRFTAVAPDPVVDPVVPPVDPPADPAVPVDPPADDAPVEAYTATIDLGDGSGVQVFEGATKDELLQKLITAQENATRKIRELTAKQTPVAPVVDAPAPVVNPDDEAALAQAILSEPSAAIRRILEQELGMSVQDAKAKLQQANQIALEQEGNRIATEFVATHPEYHPDKRNQDRIEKYMKLNSLPFTVQGIEQAFTALSTDGLLVPKPAPAVPDAPGPRSSGLSTRRSAPPTPPAPASKVRDAYKMSMEDLAALIRSGAQI